MIELKQVSKVYPSANGHVAALDCIDLSVEKGDIVGIIGASGAGKSTLLRLMNLLERPTTGEVIVNQQSLTRLTPKALRAARRQIGMIFQHFNLLNTRNVHDNIAFPLEIAGSDSDTIEQKVSELAQLTGLTSKLQHYPGQLSGGQKQRVAIARALATDCQVLLCDEATSSLDPETTRSILSLLEKVRQTLNVTIVLITHEMDVVKSICDRLAIIDQGRLVEQGNVGAFFSNPKTVLAKQFVESTLRKKLPLPIEQHLQQSMAPGLLPVLRLWFLRGTAADPVLSEMIKTFEVSVCIVQANLEYVQHHPMGIMILTLRGAPGQCSRCVTFLTQRGIRVEELGYVPDSPIAFEEEVP